MKVRNQDGIVAMSRATTVRVGRLKRASGLNFLLGLMAVCVLALMSVFVQPGNGAPQNPTKNQKSAVTKDANYYMRLLDSSFFDVGRVVELGMDYALTYKNKIDKELLEWAAGRDMKDPEDDSYFQAMNTLDQGWRLLLKSGTVYHEMRERQVDDATTQQLRAEARELYKQGVEKVREAERLRKVADEKRTARLEAKWAKEEEEKEAAKQRKLNEVKTAAGKFGQLNDEEAGENNLHDSNIASITQSTAGNPKRRQALLAKEDDRHDQRMADIDKRRMELANQTDITRTPSREQPDWKSSEGEYGRSDNPNWKSAVKDECYPLIPRKYEGCGADLAKENARWQREKAQNTTDSEKENARSKRRLDALGDEKTPSRNPTQETDCHAKNAAQLEEESSALEERHLKCFAKLTGVKGN
jgi:hypothetical protein